MNIQKILITTISLLAIVSCGGGGGGGTGADGGGTDGGGTGTDGGGNGGETKNSYSSLSGKGGSVTADGVKLQSTISGNGGSTFIYNPIKRGDSTFVPTGVMLDNVQVVVGGNPITEKSDDEALFAINANDPRTTSNKDLGGITFNGYFSESYYGSDGRNTGFGTGDISMTTSADASKVTLNAPRSRAIDGESDLTWDSKTGAYSIDKTENGVEAFAELYIFGNSGAAGGYHVKENGGATIGSMAGATK